MALITSDCAPSTAANPWAAHAAGGVGGAGEVTGMLTTANSGPHNFGGRGRGRGG